MLHKIIRDKKNFWIKSERCPIKPLIDYIRLKGELRETQVVAIETYLFLKIAGQNRPLWKLFSEGFFAGDETITNVN